MKMKNYIKTLKYFILKAKLPDFRLWSLPPSCSLDAADQRKTACRTTGLYQLFPKGGNSFTHQTPGQITNRGRVKNVKQYILFPVRPLSSVSTAETGPKSPCWTPRMV